LILRGSNNDAVFIGTSGGRVGIGKTPNSTAKMTLFQTGTTPFISFDANNVIANGSNISTEAVGSVYGRVAVAIAGVAGTKYIEIFN
jgi:hypothetical protein